MVGLRAEIEKTTGCSECKLWSVDVSSSRVIVLNRAIYIDRTLEFSVDQLLDSHALAMSFAVCPLVILKK